MRNKGGHNEAGEPVDREQKRSTQKVLKNILSINV